MKPVRLPALAAALLAACQSSSPASLALPSGEDNGAALVREVLAAAQQGPAAQACVAVLATDGAVSGIPLSPNRSPWTRRLEADTRPQLQGNLVVFAHGTTLHGLRAHSGESVFEARLPHARLIGATVHGERLFAVTRAEDGSTGRLTVYDATDGAELDSRPLPADSGRPHAVGDLLLLPLQHQSVAVLDPATLHERDRLRVTDGLLNFLQPTAHHLLLGDQQVRVLNSGFDGRVAALPELMVPHPDLPGTQHPFPSDYAFVPGGDSAFGRVGLHLSIEPAATGSPELKRAYAVFYRHAYALSPQGELKWARALPADVVRAVATARGLLAVLGDGRVVLLDAAEETAIASASAATHSAALPSTPCQPPGPGTPTAGGLSDALLRILADRDARLLPSQLFALQTLRSLPGDAVTRGILDVASDTRRNAPLRDAARRALMTRTEGTPVLLQAAARGYDYLNGIPAPPMAVLAPALEAHSATEAVPVLRARLFDHATPTAELVPIAQALATLDDQAARQALRMFLFRYRADSSFATAPEVYAALAARYGQLTGASGLHELRGLAAAETTHPLLRLALTQTLPPEAHNAAPTVAQADAPATTPPIMATQAKPRSYLLSADQVRRTFESHADDIPTCLSTRKAPTDVTQVRVALVVDANGQPLERYYLPDDGDFIACMEPLLSEYAFPASVAPRQVVVYTWNVAREATDSTSPAPTAQPFWHAYVPPATDLPKAHGTPFWQDQNPLYVSVDLGYARTTARIATDAAKPSPTDQDSSAPESTPAAQTGTARSASSPPAPPKATPAAKPGQSGPDTSAPAEVKPAESEPPWWAPTEG